MGIRLGCVAMFAVAFAACTPAPAWEPGDAPLAINAASDEAWAVMAEGCAAWAMTGLTCRRATYADDAAVSVVIDPAYPNRWASADTTWRPETARNMSPRWTYVVTLAPWHGDWPATGPHEVGHLLGIWGHLDEPLALMSDGYHLSTVPTDVDLDALSEAWGVAPWEDSQ